MNDETSKSPKPLNAGWSSTVVLLLLLPLSGCSSTQKAEDTVVIDKIKYPSAYKIAIVNASKGMINDIKYKPCNTHDVHYQQLTGNLKPMEKFTVNLYAQCVDLMATNAFKKKLVDAKNVDLKSVKIWTIQ